MPRTRVIPFLLLSNGELVKTRKFGDELYVGDPINAALIFNEKEVDELSLIDISKATNPAPLDFPLLKDIACQANMPLMYGGGVRSVADAVELVRLGFEKVSFSSAALSDPSLVSDACRELGCQSVAVCLDVRASRDRPDSYDVFVDRGRKKLDGDAMYWSRVFEGCGAGEIIYNSVDRDGMRIGYDLYLASLARNAVKCNVTFVGGADRPEDIVSLERAVGTVGAGAGSMFVFKGKNNAVLLSYSRGAA
jgi:cyclase